MAEMMSEEQGEELQKIVIAFIDSLEVQDNVARASAEAGVDEMICSYRKRFNSTLKIEIKSPEK